MKTISIIMIDLNKPEQVVSFAEGSGLLSAEYGEDEGNEYAYVKVIESLDAPDEDVTWYVLADGDEFPDTFPGLYWKTVTTPRGDAHLFFKPKARKPIVVDPNGPGAQKRGNGNGGA